MGRKEDGIRSRKSWLKLNYLLRETLERTERGKELCSASCFLWSNLLPSFLTLHSLPLSLPLYPWIILTLFFQNTKWAAAVSSKVSNVLSFGLSFASLCTLLSWNERSHLTLLSLFPLFCICTLHKNGNNDWTWNLIYARTFLAPNVHWSLEQYSLLHSFGILWLTTNMQLETIPREWFPGVYLYKLTMSEHDLNHGNIRIKSRVPGNERSGDLFHLSNQQWTDSVQSVRSGRLLHGPNNGGGHLFLVRSWIDITTDDAPSERSSIKWWTPWWPLSIHSPLSWTSGTDPSTRNWTSPFTISSASGGAILHPSPTFNLHCPATAATRFLVRILVRWSWSSYWNNC